MPKNIFIVAGEASGDFNAANLMKALKLLNNNISFIGIGGQEMAAEGLSTIVPLEDISIVGFWEVAKKIKFIQGIFKKCRAIFSTQRIDLLILVDFPGFNLKLASIAKEFSIPVCYYIAPQVWAWGKSRILKIQGFVDLLFVVFPFEKEFYKQNGIEAHFVGHPIMDNEIFQGDFLLPTERENTIAILPGSRKQEIVNHKKIIDDLVLKIKKEIKGYKIALPLTQNIANTDMLKHLRYGGEIEIVSDSRELMKKSKVGIIKTGTSNLEAALLGLPFVMFYKTSKISYTIGKFLVKLGEISIVNILLGRKIVPEFIQTEATAEKIFNAIKFILGSDDVYCEMQRYFYEVKSLLGGPGASKRAAEIIVKYFNL